MLRDVGYNNGLGVDDASKCSNLKQMILPEAQLETALSMARTQGLFNGPFDDLIHFLKAEIDEITLRRSQLRANRSHRVSSVSTSRTSNGRNNRGRGGRGRGRQQNYGNRNRNILTRMVDGRQVHSGNYTPEEYRRLTPSQREAVKALRRQARLQATEQANQNRNERRSIVSGVTVAPETTSDTTGGNSVMSPLTQSSSAANASTNAAPAGSVGSYLGSRRSHHTQSPSA